MKIRLYYMHQDLFSEGFSRRYIAHVAKAKTTDDREEAIVFDSHKSADIAKEFCKTIFRKKIGKEIEK